MTDPADPPKPFVPGPPARRRRHPQRHAHGQPHRQPHWLRPTLAGVVATVVSIATIWVLGTSRASAQAVNLLPDGEVPTTVTDPDTRAVELGLRFRAREAVTAVAVQVYETPANPAPLHATLWTSHGRALARATLSGPARTGLQTFALDRRVALLAGRSYVVSYTAPQGHYPVTEGYFVSTVTNGPLAADRDAGVYTYSPGTFPRSTYQASNYHVDVVVETAASGSPAPTRSASPSTTPSTTTSPGPSHTAGPSPSSTSTTPTGTTTPSRTASATASATPSPTSTPTSATGRFPTADTAGLPAGWRPTKQVTGDYWIRTAGAVVEDLEVTNGTIFVAARNVTLRRISAVGSRINNDVNGTCNTGLVVEDSDITRGAGRTADTDPPAVGPGGYTVRNVRIDGVPEGLRAGGKDLCGGISVADSFVRVTSPDVCNDWHGDGLQGYDGGRVTVRNTSIVLDEINNCYGTAPFFYPAGQGNTGPVDVDGLLVSGGGYSFRLGMTGTVKNLDIVDGAWGYAPFDVDCSLVTQWQAAAVRLDSAGQPVVVRSLPCSG